MENSQRLILVRLGSLAALAFSAALLAAYWRPGSLLCGYDFDCDTVLSSSYGKVAGVPLPVLGLAGFAAIFACSLSARPGTTLLLRLLALAAALVGGGLIYIQVAVLQQLCPFCLIVDFSSLVVAFAALGWRADGSTMATVRARRLWLASALAALGLGAAFGTAKNWMPAEDDTIPPQVSAHWVPGKITIVEIVDFECPHCRQFHAILTGFLSEYGERIHLVRIVSPMEKHPHARDAARAYLCAVAQNKGDEMAELLFAAKDLTPAGCARLAASLGLSLAQFRESVASGEIDRQIDDNIAWVTKACPHGLPCLWVQDQRLRGSQTHHELAVAFTKAELRLRAEHPEPIYPAE